MIERKVISMNKNEKLLDAINTASAQWKAAFNSGDVLSCVEQYESSAVMHARNLGTKKGPTEIQNFWQKLIDDGYSTVEYINPKINIVNETSAILTAKWKMKKANGVIHKELWVLQEDGTAKLREDDFEIKE